MPFEVDSVVTFANIRVALQYPFVLTALLRQGKVGAMAAVLSHLLHEFSRHSDGQIASLLRRSESSKSLMVPQDLDAFQRSKSLTYILIPYYLTRVFKPRTVVETGVWSGKTTWSILQAMKDNGHGQLFSIDKGVRSFARTRLPVRDIGGLVPEFLRERWTLIIGDSRAELGNLCKKLGSLDMFLHDSDHSYEHMLFEFRTALEIMRDGGILSGDDVNLNNAFNLVSNELRNVHVIGERFGYGFKAPTHLSQEFGAKVRGVTSSTHKVCYDSSHL